MAKEPKPSKIDVDKITNDLTIKIAKEKLDVYTEYQRDALAHFVKQVTDLTNHAPAEEISSVANFIEKWIRNHPTIISFKDLDKLLLQIKELPKVDEVAPEDDTEDTTLVNPQKDSDVGVDVYTGYTKEEEDEEFPTIDNDVNDEDKIDVEESEQDDLSDTQAETEDEEPEDSDIAGAEQSVILEEAPEQDDLTDTQAETEDEQPKDNDTVETEQSVILEEVETQDSVQEETPIQTETATVEDDYEEAFSDVELTCVANNSTDESEEMDDFWADEDTEETSTTANEGDTTPIEVSPSNDVASQENAEEVTTPTETVVEQTPNAEEHKVSPQDKVETKPAKKKAPPINPFTQAAHYNIKQLHEQFSYVPFAESASIINKAGWILARNNVAIEEFKSCSTLDDVVQKVNEMFGPDTITVKPPKKTNEELLQEKQAAHALIAQLNALLKHESPTDRRTLVPKIAWKVVKMGKDPKPYLKCKSLAELKELASKL